MRTTPRGYRRSSLIDSAAGRMDSSSSPCTGKTRNTRRSPGSWRVWHGCGGKQIAESLPPGRASMRLRSTMAIQWTKDVDAALAQARTKNQALLLDFNAAPMCGACARLDAEVYP